MDMQAAAERHEIERAVADAKAEHDIVFIAPRPDDSVDDGILTYGDVVSIEDLITASGKNVLLFAESDKALLDMLIKHQDRFGVRTQVLIGLPTSNYGAWWNSSTWMLDKVSYPTLISELSLANRIEEERRVASQTVIEKEQDQYTRSDGTVKDHTKYEVSLPDDEEHE